MERSAWLGLLEISVTRQKRLVWALLFIRFPTGNIDSAGSIVVGVT